MSDPQKYTIGWICAIATEYTAACQFLDKKHSLPTHISAHDTNGYTLGEMAGHNIVIAVLPRGEYGLSSAASVAANMLNSFPNIRIGLMVGVGGGAPTADHDIRLGDVVVSSPGDQTGGVYQYDYGKTIQGRKFLQTGFLNKPPAVVLTAVSVLESTYESEGHDIESRITTILESKPRLRKKYSRPDRQTDCLYKSSIIHPYMTEGDCEELCGRQPHRLVQRREREEDENSPNIHYGVIASGNQLMKDATRRDALAKEKGILCFEMEAAGLMNGFPFLIVRGICDYSDSHKNKQWQGYAAMTAAAYAKDLLGKMVPSSVEHTAKINEVLSSLSQKVEVLHTTTLRMHNGIETLHIQEETDRIMNWLSAPEPSTNHNKALEQHYDGTGLWFIQGPVFREWKKQTDSFLWLYGIPGCGKTVLSSTIIRHLKQNATCQPVLYFYFDFNDECKQSLDNLLRSLIEQVYQVQQDGRQHLAQLWELHGRGSQQPSRSSLEGLLRVMLGGVGSMSIVLDALDEAKPRGELLTWLKKLVQSSHIACRLLVTARREEDIQSAFESWTRAENMILIQSGDVNKDISAYVKDNVRNGDDLKRWHSRRDATTILRLLAWSERPLRLDEIVDAIAVQPHARPSFDPENRMPDPRDILKICSGLVVAVCRPYKREIHRAFTPTGSIFRFPDEPDNDREKTVTELRLAHFSVKEYLTSNRVTSSFAGCFSQKTAKASIAKICLAYLSDLDHGLPSRKIRAQFAFSQYCARYWPHHARAANGKDDELQHQMMRFFNDRKGAYLTCYGLEVKDDYWSEDHARTSNESPEPLIFASLYGLMKTVEMLLDKGANVNAKDAHYGSPLMAASVGGRSQTARLLLRRGADINASGGNFDTALQAAALRGNIKTARLLLENGADVNTHGGVHCFALRASSAENFPNTTKLLLDHGADVNAQDPVYGNALLAAARRGHNKIAKLLLDNGTHVDARTGRNHINALQAAAAGGHTKTAKLLLDYGADVNAQGGKPDNAYQLALAGRYVDTMKLLVEYGACNDAEVEPSRVRS
ncbi:purine and uridine phosphorylase [Aureobasidium sp. EXF-10727]|nr:purine and uridine phosphorylase [Aureobasidium sp. EXF-10727]